VTQSISEEQKLMRQSCRAFIDDLVIPHIRANWQREWLMDPEARLAPEILEGADIFLHMDATTDISKFKIVKSMFPATAGKYAGPE
jgi:hypothetical protein